MTVSANTAIVTPPKAVLRRRRIRPELIQQASGIFLFFLIWQAARSLGYLLVIPSPLEVAGAVPSYIQQDGYWSSWANSARRVFLGFGVAAALSVPLGIWFGISTRARQILFPIFEIIRPIPPVAWLPLSILFWPSSELTMVFLTFIGAFFPIFINVLSGIDNVDVRYIQAARSLGASRRALFWKILVPATLPSLFTGLTIAIAITWEVVIAAEMASGSNGLGYLTWNSYMSQNMVGIVIGMLSIGIAGLLSSVAMNLIGRRAAPWTRR